MILAYGTRYGDPWWRRSRPIRLEGAHNNHLLCLGAPGVGKSSALYYQLEQLVQARHGFMLLDTHVDLYLQALRCLMHYGWDPSDVVLIDPTSPYGVPTLNVFEHEPGAIAYETVDELLGAFKAMWADAWGHRTEDLFRNAFLALQEVGLTLTEVEDFLTNAAFRAAVVEQLTTTQVKHFWSQHFASFRESEQHMVVEAPRNKVSGFLAHPALRAMFGAGQSTIRLAELMNQGKAVLVNLSRHRLKRVVGKIV
jgi:hypothetical protein